MAKFVVATDLSARSDRAIGRCMQLASVHGAEVVVVHVIDEQLPMSMVEEWEPLAIEAIEKQIAAQKQYPEVATKIVCLAGDPETAIENYLDSNRVGLLVTGSHRYDFIGDFFRSTTHERILRCVSTPTLIVIEPTTKPYERVLVATDFGHTAHRAFYAATKIVPKAAFRLMHVYHPVAPDQMEGDAPRQGFTANSRVKAEQLLLAKVQATLGTEYRDDVKVHTTAREGEVLETILSEVAREKPDLLVIGTHEETGVLASWFSGTSAKLVRKPPCDILVAPVGWTENLDRWAHRRLTFQPE